MEDYKEIVLKRTGDFVKKIYNNKDYISFVDKQIKRKFPNIISFRPKCGELQLGTVSMKLTSIEIKEICKIEENYDLIDGIELMICDSPVNDIKNHIIFSNYEEVLYNNLMEQFEDSEYYEFYDEEISSEELDNFLLETYNFSDKEAFDEYFIELKQSIIEKISIYVYEVFEQIQCEIVVLFQEDAHKELKNLL